MNDITLTNVCHYIFRMVLGEAYVQLADLEQKAQDKRVLLEYALLHLTMVVNSAPKNVQYNYALGRAYLLRARLAQELEQEPKDQETYLESAMQHLTIALRYAPKNAQYHCDLGMAYVQRANLAQKYLAHKPKYQKGWLKQAIPYFEQAAKLDPENAALYQHHLSDAHQKLASLQPPSAVASTPPSSPMPLSSSSFSATSSTAMITNSLVLPTSLPTSTIGLTSVASLPPAQSSSTSSGSSSSFNSNPGPLASGSSSNINSTFGLSMSSATPPLEQKVMAKTTQDDPSTKRQESATPSPSSSSSAPHCS